MTSLDPAPQPDLVGQLLGSVVRHGAGYVAGMLATWGVIATDQTTQTGAVIASLVLYALAQGWSAIRKVKRAA